MKRAAKRTGRLDLIAGLAAGEVYSIYATFSAHLIAPPDVYVVDHRTGRRLLSGEIGDIREAFDWNGLLYVVIISFVVFALTWYLVRRFLSRALTQTKVAVPNGGVSLSIPR